MNFNKLYFLLFFIFLSAYASPQSLKEVRKEKESCEKKISHYNRLLNEKNRSRSVSIGKLSVLHRKIAESRKLLETLEMEKNILQNDIYLTGQKINELNQEREEMLGLYGHLIYTAWKKRKNFNRLMFILSSSDFNQAYGRFKYFQQVQQYSSRQLEKIHQLNDSLENRNNRLRALVVEKTEVLSSIYNRNRELESEKLQENLFISQLKKEEKSIRRQLSKEMDRRKKLARKLNDLVARQIKKSASSKNSAADRILYDDFTRNKGRLPWPVSGTVVKRFGTYTDPLYKKVKISSDGIDILCLKNAPVKSVFKGVVADIGYDPYLNNMVVVSHGGFFTFYCNVVDLKVKAGDRVDTGDILGKVASNNEGGSILIFQVWKNFEKLNPESWLVKDK